MKQWAVVRCQTDALMDMVPGRGDLGFVTWAEGNVESKFPSHYTGDHPVYFLDEEGHAERLAGFLATKKPGTTWLVVKSTASFRCPPGPVTKSVFSPGGLLPAGV